MKNHILIVAIVILSLSGSSVFAEFYLGAQVNANSIDADPTGFVGANSLWTVSDDNSGFSVGAGWKFTKNLSAELHYSYLGNIAGTTLSVETINTPLDRTDPDSPRYSHASIHEMEAEFSTLTPAIKISLPADESFYVYAKLGIDVWQSDATFSYNVTLDDRPDNGIEPGLYVGTTTDSGANLFFGAGGVFNISPAMKIYAEYDIHRFNAALNIASGISGTPDIAGEAEISVNSITFGIEYHFVSFVDELFEVDF